jgi:hypothetical protein
MDTALFTSIEPGRGKTLRVFLNPEGFNAEAELLCACLGAETDESTLARLGQLSASAWEQILHQAIRQNVGPLLYHQFKTLSPSIEIPTTIMQRLRVIYLANAARNMRLYHQLTSILTVLRENGIPVIVLKGAHLSEIVYGNIALRVMSDVDLLIMKKDLAKSQQKLIEGGYSFRNELIPIDIHWNIALSIVNPNITVEKMWERAQPEFIAGVEVLVLAPEDLLLHLCLHLSVQHLFRCAGLRSLYDIQKAIHYYAQQIKWEQITRRASECGIHHAVYLTLLLARDIVGARVPDAVIEALTPDRFDPNITEWALEQIFQEMGDKMTLSPYFWRLWKPGSLREKSVSFRRLLFPPPEFVSQKYPAPFGSLRNYLYYLVRLKDHFMPYTRALWRILLHDDEMTSQVKRQNRNLTMKERLLSR